MDNKSILFMKTHRILFDSSTENIKKTKNFQKDFITKLSLNKKGIQFLAKFYKEIGIKIHETNYKSIMVLGENLIY
jgi:hypothetical protein